MPVLRSQQQFVESTAPVKGFSGPVGSGKTFALCYEALRCATRNPGCTGLLGAPTYPMLHDVTVPTLLGLLQQLAIPARYLKQDNVLMLERSRSRILLRSLHCPERLRGSNLAWVGVDELTYCRREDRWSAKGTFKSDQGGERKARAAVRWSRLVRLTVLR